MVYNVHSTFPKIVHNSDIRKPLGITQQLLFPCCLGLTLEYINSFRAGREQVLDKRDLMGKTKERVLIQDDMKKSVDLARVLGFASPVLSVRKPLREKILRNLFMLEGGFTIY